MAGLLDMTPRLSREDSRHRLLADAILAGKPSSANSPGSIARPRLSDLICCQLRPTIGFATAHLLGILARPMAITARHHLWFASSMMAIAARSSFRMNGKTGASLAHHIVHVVGLRACEQVIRAHATWVVAFMQDEQAVRNIPVVQHPRDTVRPYTAAWRANLAIPIGVAVPRPLPARITFDFAHEEPKTICERKLAMTARWKMRGTNCATVFASARRGKIGHVGSSLQLSSAPRAGDAAPWLSYANYTIGAGK
jgi:hypothetical protein